MDGTHQGGGFANVIEGIEHFPGHVIEALGSHDSVLSRLLKSAPAQQLINYEKTHGKDQIAAIEKAGMDEFRKQRSAGVDKAHALVAAIAVAFESGLPEVKSLGTLAMGMLLDAASAAP